MSVPTTIVLFFKGFRCRRAAFSSLFEKSSFYCPFFTYIVFLRSFSRSSNVLHLSVLHFQRPKISHQGLYGQNECLHKFTQRNKERSFHVSCSITYLLIIEIKSSPPTGLLTARLRPDCLHRFCNCSTGFRLVSLLSFLFVACV